MDFLTFFFVLLSIFVIVYIAVTFRTEKRMPILLEFFFITIYAFVFVIFLFPNTLKIIEELFGIASAINFIVYLSIFISYFLLFILYQKDENQRIEISKLNRELALTRKDFEELKNKSNIVGKNKEEEKKTVIKKK